MLIFTNIKKKKEINKKIKRNSTERGLILNTLVGWFFDPVSSFEKFTTTTCPFSFERESTILQLISASRTRSFNVLAQRK